MKKTRFYKKMKLLPIQSTVTGKRQITIPKEICEYFDLKNGDHISFIEKNGQIIFEPTDYTVPCLICDGTGYIESKGCFVCHQTGVIDKVVLQDNLRFLAYLGMNAFTYHVSIGYKCISVAYKNEDTYLDFPVLTLDSKEYNANTLKWIRDYIQINFIQREIHSNIKKAIKHREVFLKGIEVSMLPEEKVEKLKSWFEQTCNSYM